MGRNVEVEAEGLILHYRDESFWNEDGFSRILQGQAGFKFSEVRQFIEHLSEYRLSATGYEIEFNESRRSTVLTCDIHGAISKSGERYTAEFEWLLEGLGFDLYAFEQTEEELSCEEEVNGVPTTFSLGFPAAINHCHYHVWWTAK